MPWLADAGGGGQGGQRLTALPSSGRRVIASLESWQGVVIWQCQNCAAFPHYLDASSVCLPTYRLLLLLLPQVCA